MSGFVAVMVEPRGGLLSGSSAFVLNRAVFSTAQEAQERADSQERFERALGAWKPGQRVVVLPLPDPLPEP